MDLIVLIVMIIIFLGLAYLIYYFFKQKKYHWIPSSILVKVSIFLLAYPTLFPQNSDGWNDLGYVILGIFLFLFACALAIIIGVVRYIKQKQKKIQIALIVFFLLLCIKESKIKIVNLLKGA